MGFTLIEVLVALVIVAVALVVCGVAPLRAAWLDLAVLTDRYSELRGSNALPAVDPDAPRVEMSYIGG